MTVKPENFTLQIKTSEYSRKYAQYLKTEFHQVEPLIRNLVKKSFCKDYYLKYPLEGLLKGICKKLLINVYEFVVYGYFLSQVEWKLDHYIYSSLAEVFPNIIHVNEPTDPNTLKQLSMFLYFSSYSVKEFLNDDIQSIKAEMIKIFPEFEQLQTYWTSNQQTVGQVLNPKALNTFYRSLMRVKSMVDLNSCVDKILQISPCYDITGRDKAKEVPSFGFLNIDNNVQANYGSEVVLQNLQLKLEDNL